jgi:hypothetical protein
MMSLLTVAAANLLNLTLAVADGPPRFDSAAGCKAASQINQSLDLSVSQDYQACMKDEDAARQELNQDWAKYDAKERTRCVGQTTVGGFPSYVEVVECLRVTVDLKSQPPR